MWCNLGEDPECQSWSEGCGAFANLLATYQRVNAKGMPVAIGTIIAAVAALIELRLSDTVQWPDPQ
jgi:hypothetical protein